ncbi:hypothetical protein OH768_09735 [Streptomyces sp. NBC_01622]|uniref:hypothetical protein n=1 Tax=Streptomyces sp. NBC_01622 TaxID=2975903 RepID=UPI003868429C|nr:hypothetical protein OH768_09735 [Streptomyces sp. NBC_01622]
MSDVWSVLSEGFRPTERVARDWLSGLGLNPAAPTDAMLSLFDAGEASFLYRADLPADVLDAAVVHPSRNVWGRAAESGKLSRDQWDRLLAATAGLPLHGVLAEMAEEHDDSRRRGARVGVGRPSSPDSRPPATPAEIAAMAETVPDITADDRSYALWWIAALYDDPAAMRQLASSANLLIRRSVARALRLPPDVVDLPAHDEDRVVRLFLTESCDDAPGDLLLDVWSWWPGSFSFPGRPRNHPDFPRDGLLRFADDPRPRIRLLALDDPASTGELVERSGRDPDADVRARAAGDPRLSPESAAGLAHDDVVRVHRAARRNPVLPPTSLVPLLLDKRSALDAARNPALPVAVMHHMIALTEQGPHAHA